MQRLGFLDSLRGLAILGVLLVHVGQSDGLTSGALFNFTAYGARGVQLFYMVSAFTLLSVARHPFNVRSFFIRRFFRIAPVFYVAVIAYLLVDGLGPRYYAPEGIGLRQALLTVLFLHGLSPDAVNAIVPGGWSIACEMMFYVAFPWLARVVTSLPRAIIGFGVACLVSQVAVHVLQNLVSGPSYLVRDFAFFSVFAQAPVFLAGFVVFYLTKLPSKIWAYGLAIVAVATLSVFALEGGRTSNHLLSILPFALLLWAMSSFNVAPLDNPMTRALGKVSFSLYLSHHLVMAVLNKMMSIRGLPGLLILTVLTVVIAGAISWALYRFIEQPGIRIGRAFSLGSQTPASGEPAPSQRW